MAALSAGSEDISAQSGITIDAVEASFTPAAGTYSKQTATYKVEIANVILFEKGFEYFIEISNCYK